MPVCKKCATAVSDDDVRYLGDKANPYCQDCLDIKLAKLEEPEKIIVACSARSATDYDASYDGALELFGVETMTYSEGQKRQKKKDSSLQGKQLEHPIPNSCFMQNSGRKGTVVHGGGGYSEGSAVIFPVGDDQKAGTEHKFLTNRERAMAKKLESEGRYATPSQWLQTMVPTWEENLIKFHTAKYAQTKKIKDKKTGKMRHLTKIEMATEIRADAKRAARALAQKTRTSLKRQKVLDSARLKNGLAGRSAKAPSAKLSKSMKLEDF